MGRKESGEGKVGVDEGENAGREGEILILPQAPFLWEPARRLAQRLLGNYLLSRDWDEFFDRLTVFPELKKTITTEKKKKKKKKLRFFLPRLILPPRI